MANNSLVAGRTREYHCMIYYRLNIRETQKFLVLSGIQICEFHSSMIPQLEYIFCRVLQELALGIFKRLGRLEQI